jgi:integrase
MSGDETNALASACESFEEKLVVCTLRDTGLRVSEFAALTKDNVQLQARRLVIHSNCGPNDASLRGRSGL